MKTYQLVQIIVFALIYLKQSYAYNILGVFPHLGKSHIDVFIPLMKGLAEKGHNVTVISHFPLPKPFPNYKDIDLGAGSQAFVDVFDMEQIDTTSRLFKVKNALLLSHLANISCEIGLSSKALKNFLKTEKKFDLLIIEFFNSDCFLGLSQIVKAPIIGLSSCTLLPWSSERFANPSHTAYLPNNHMDYSDRMTFLERVENTLVTLIHQFHYNYVTISRDEVIARKYLGEEAAHIRDFIKNSSLLLVNTHFTLNLPRPLVPNVVEVGGIHIGKNQTLPEITITAKYKYYYNTPFIKEGEN